MNGGVGVGVGDYRASIAGAGSGSGPGSTREGYIDGEGRGERKRVALDDSFLRRAYKRRRTKEGEIEGWDGSIHHLVYSN